MEATTVVKPRTEEEVRRVIEEIDLDPIKVKLMDTKEGLSWTRDCADEVERLYRHFLFLSWKYSDRPITPSWDIDDFWHFHILDTMKYVEDCNRIFGHYLHHFPYFGMRDEEDAAKLTAAAEETRRLFYEECGVDPSQTPALVGGRKCGKYCGSVVPGINPGGLDILQVQRRPTLPPRR